MSAFRKYVTEVSTGVTILMFIFLNTLCTILQFCSLLPIPCYVYPCSWSVWFSYKVIVFSVEKTSTVHIFWASPADKWRTRCWSLYTVHRNGWWVFVRTVKDLVHVLVLKSVRFSIMLTREGTHIVSYTSRRLLWPTMIHIWPRDRPPPLHWAVNTTYVV